MKVHSAVSLLSTLSIIAIAISPASAALRGNGKGNIFGGTNNDKIGNGQGNGKDKGYNDMVNDIKSSLENGESLGKARLKQLKLKFKKEKLKVNGRKSKWFEFG